MTTRDRERLRWVWAAVFALVLVLAVPSAVRPVARQAASAVLGAVAYVCANTAERLEVGG